MFSFKDIIIVVIITVYASIIMLNISRLDNKISEMGDALNINEDGTCEILFHD